MDRALGQLEDSVARGEIIGRWAGAIAACPPGERLALQRAAAERALAVGEAEEAHRWARAAAALTPDDVAVTMLLGRSLVALGDLVAAEVTLRRAARKLDAASEAPLAALVAAELAEVAYLKGELGAAREAAEKRALVRPAPSTAPRRRLKARNTLGKLLLAAPGGTTPTVISRRTRCRGSHGDTRRSCAPG